MFPAVATTWGGLYSLVLNGVAMIVIVVLYDRRRLVRDPQGQRTASYWLPQCERSSISSWENGL